MKKLKLEYSWASQVVLVIKNPPANAGDIRNTGSTPGSGRPTPVFLPEKSHRQRRLAGSSPWGHKESHMTEQLILAQFIYNVVVVSWVRQSESVIHTHIFTLFKFSSHVSH